MVAKGYTIPIFVETPQSAPDDLPGATPSGRLSASATRIANACGIQCTRRPAIHQKRRPRQVESPMPAPGVNPWNTALRVSGTAPQRNAPVVWTIEIGRRLGKRRDAPTGCTRQDIAGGLGASLPLLPARIGSHRPFPTSTRPRSTIASSAITTNGRGSTVSPPLPSCATICTRPMP